MRADASDQPRLGLIVGGVQKAGTTSLLGYLSEHPQMATPSLTTRLKTGPSRTIRGWRAFSPKDIGIRIGFDVTPIYLFWSPGENRTIRSRNKTGLHLSRSDRAGLVAVAYGDRQALGAFDLSADPYQWNNLIGDARFEPVRLDLGAASRLIIEIAIGVSKKTSSYAFNPAVCDTGRRGPGMAL